LSKIPAKNGGYAAEMRYRDDTHLTPAQRDRTIIDLRKRGLSYRAIGKQVGMDGSAVMRAWRRLEAGGPGTKPRWQ
jgi:hypothetical protein